MESQNFYSYGKLLLSGEYLVLDGAIALAVPVKLGQSLLAGESDTKGIEWHAFQPDGLWFKASFDADLNIVHSSDNLVADRLRELLSAARDLNKEFLLPGKNFKVETYLEFNRFWGLGSSSTLIANLARWAKIDPYALNYSVSKGSGYDIACASAFGPLLYQLINKQPEIKPIHFKPWFRDSLYFVYMGRKQNTDTGIFEYQKKEAIKEDSIRKVSKISEDMLTTNSLEEFSQLLEEHETIISQLLDAPKLMDTVFKGFPGTAKSLGAWGGDFAMLATDIGEYELRKYLGNKGLQTLFCFDELIVQNP